MSDKKQTAVNWLVEQLNSKYGSNDFIITHNNEIEQAKQIEKEQLEDAWYAGDEDGAIHEFEQYYEQTFGGNNEQQ